MKKKLTPLAIKIQEYFDLRIPDKEIIKKLGIFPQGLYYNEYTFKLRRKSFVKKVKDKSNTSPN